MAFEKSHHFKFSAGHNVSYTLYSNRKNNPSQILFFILPAMGIRASYYKRLARCIVDETEQDVITMDYRGMGSSSIRASRKNKIGYQAVVDDLNEVIIQEKFNIQYSSIKLCGHSLGGQIACMYASRYPDHIHHIILIGSSLPYYKSWQGRRKRGLKIAGSIFYPISKCLGYFPGDKFGFAGKEGMNTMKDWCQLVKTGVFKPVNSSFNYEAAILNYQGEITAFSFSEDKMAPYEVSDALVKKFINASHSNHHLLKGYDHFNWSKSPYTIVKLLV
jgi:predicted alpha/beta hydrolase